MQSVRGRLWHSMSSTFHSRKYGTYESFSLPRSHIFFNTIQWLSPKSMPSSAVACECNETERSMTITLLFWTRNHYAHRCSWFINFHVNYDFATTCVDRINRRNNGQRSIRPLSLLQISLCPRSLLTANVETFGRYSLQVCALFKKLFMDT